MVDNDTVIVVGAGASCEVGLPTGSDLKELIARQLDIFYDAGRLIRGDALLAEAVKEKARRAGAHAEYMSAAATTCQALPFAISIDNYLDAHQGNAVVESCCKLAIVGTILAAERRSTLYIDPQRPKPFTPTVHRTWFTRFFQMLTQNCAEADLRARLARFTLIIFNYDRCVEHYLFHALQAYYNMSPEIAAKLISEIAIFHPYGAVGRLPWQGGDTPTEFGCEPTYNQLVDLEGSIKTFAEGTDPGDSAINQLRESVQDATCLYFWALHSTSRMCGSSLHGIAVCPPRFLRLQRAFQKMTSRL